MDLMSGYPFWPIKNGLIASYPALKQDLTCDVAVIGGGITGALIAYHLTEAGCDTVLVDRRDIGGGSTSASTALLPYEVDTPLFQLIDMVGREHAVRSYLLCLEAIGKLGRLIGELRGDYKSEHTATWPCVDDLPQPNQRLVVVAAICSPESMRVVIEHQDSVRLCHLTRSLVIGGQGRVLALEVLLRYQSDVFLGGQEQLIKFPIRGANLVAND